MENIINFLTKETLIGNTFPIQNWVFLTVAIAVVIIVIAIISSTRNIKKENAKNKENELANENVDNSLSASEASKQYFDIIAETKCDVEKTTSKVSKEEKPIIKEKSEIKAEKITTSEQKSSNDKISSELVNEDTVIIDEEIDTDKERAVHGKFTVCNSSLGDFRYMLIANNGQLLYESKDYKSKSSCINAISNFAVAVKSGDFTVKKDKFDRFKFILRPLSNSNTIFVGESFSNAASCTSNINSVKKFVDMEPQFVDRTKEDFVAYSTSYKIPDAIKNEVAANNGAAGKWEIAKVDETVNTSSFVYLLYANNGQLLYESKEYKAYATCKNGLITFINTVQNGNFIIDEDKAKRFKFILRSNKAGSQAEYIGQFYRNKTTCQNSIDSLYKFALLSSLEDLR
jgi:uncharacterized protein YegP (UPF0339 family)